MTELIICTTCRTAETPRGERAAGEALLESVQALHAFGDQPEWSQVQVRGTACMSGCSRSCTVAFQAPGKFSYLFGDLTPDNACAHALLDAAVLHHRTPDGVLNRDQRPQALRNGILCRLPPALASDTTGVHP